jgi:hypothetical protein
MRKFILIFILSLSLFTQVAHAYAEEIFYKTILTTHPRILISEKNIDGLRKKITWLLSDLYRKFIDSCHSPERGTSNINRYIYSQGYAYLMSGDSKWADKAISAMDQVPAYLSAYGTSPDSIADSLEALAIGFDWCYNRIVETGNKDKFIKLINEYTKTVKHKFEKDVYTDFHNYATNFTNSVLFAGLALWGEDEAAKDHIAWARGIFEEGYQVNRTVYKTLDSINFVDGACNWEAPTYQRQSLFRIIKYIEALDTATGGVHDLWHTKFSALENAGYYMLYMTRPDNLFENIGDAAWHSISYKEINNLSLLQSRFKNPYFTTYLDKYFQWESGAVKPVIPVDQGYQYQIFYLLWYDPDIKAKPFDDLTLSKKFGDEIIIRDGWHKDGVMATFKAGMHWGGHSQLDHGSFTIYKNAPLAIDSGYYDSWNPGTHIWDYWKRTIAHNSIIIFDSKEEWPVYAGKRYNDGGQRMAFRKYKPPYTDSYGYFSPKSTNEPLSITYIKEHNEEFRMGAIDAYESDGSFVYIRADLTNAYNNIYSGQGDNQKKKTDLVKREFVYIRPGYIIVLDRVNIVAKNLKISWLLHCGRYADPEKSAPYIYSNNTWEQTKAGVIDYTSDFVRIDNGKGRLFCKTLLPEKNIITTVGGRSYEFWVNNKNIETTEKTIQIGAEPGAWRIEVKPAFAEKENIFFHVLYPCDITTETMLVAEKIVCNSAYGSKVGDVVVVFAESEDSLSYELKTEGAMRHLICDLSKGAVYRIESKEIETNKVFITELNSSENGILQFSTNHKLNGTIKISKN